MFPPSFINELISINKNNGIKELRSNLVTIGIEVPENNQHQMECSKNVTRWRKNSCIVCFKYQIFF